MQWEVHLACQNSCFSSPQKFTTEYSFNWSKEKMKSKVAVDDYRWKYVAFGD